MEKDFEFKLYNKDSALVTAIVLSLSKPNEATEERIGKKGTVNLCGT